MDSFAQLAVIVNQPGGMEPIACGKGCLPASDASLGKPLVSHGIAADIGYQRRKDVSYPGIHGLQVVSDKVQLCSAAAIGFVLGDKGRQP